MIRYTPQNQLTFEQFQIPFERSLDPQNRWVKLARELPWDGCAAIYFRALNADWGRPALDARLAIGSLVIKHILGLSDREVVQTIAENVYIQYFVGFSSFNPEPAFDPSLFVTLRKRMGMEAFDEMNDLIISKALGLKSKADDADGEEEPGEQGPEESQASQQEQPSDQAKEEPPPGNKGRLKLDATVADQMIVYPTDLGLLNRARLESERLIDILHQQSGAMLKPRTYRRVALKSYLAVAKKKNKHKKTIRRSIGRQLRYLRRNLKTIHRMWDQSGQVSSPLKFRDLRLFWIIQVVYEQQQYMYEQRLHKHPHRIVNLYQPQVRPIPRGKDKAKIEFGAKLGVSESQGFCRLDHLSWDAYYEGGDLIPQVERYRALYGYYPEVVMVDQIYLSRDNRRWLQSKHIRHIGKPLGRPPKLTTYQKRKQKKERAMRNHIEGKFGQGKNAYELNCIRARRADTSESWIAAIFFAMNLVRWWKIMPILILLIDLWLFYFASWAFERCQMALGKAARRLRATGNDFIYQSTSFGPSASGSAS